MKRRRVGKVLLVGLFALAGVLLFDLKSNEEYSNIYVGDTYLSRVEKEATPENPTYLGVAYLNPLDLSEECDYSDTINIMNGTNSGCMRWFIFEESDTTYKMLLDHNTSENVPWISKEDYVNAFDVAEQENAASDYEAYANLNIKGAITMENQLATDTAGWAGNPRLLTASEIATIVGGTVDKTTNMDIPSTYGWLFEKTSSCSTNGCINQEPRSGYVGYWTPDKVEDDNSRVWGINGNGKMSRTYADVTTLGIRPYIELRKDQVDGAFNLTQSTFDTPTNGVSVVGDAYCLTAGKYELNENVTLSKSINLGTPCGLAEGTDVIIDLNGYTLTIGDNEFETDSTRLNITGEGEVVSNGTALLINGGTVTLDDSISYTGTIDIRGGTTTIDGVSVNSTTNALVVSEGANVTINHGDFVGTTYGLLVYGGTTQITSASFTGTAYAVAVTDTMSFEDLLVNPNVFNDTDLSDYIESDGLKKLNTAETSVGIKTTYSLDFTGYNVDENGRVLFTNSAITPTVTVKVGEDTLVQDTDYTVEFKNNTNVGEASVVIKRISSSAYTFANKTLKFEIYKIAMDMDKLEISVEDEDDIVYTGSAIVPTYTVLYDTVLFSDVEQNFDFTAEDNVNAGTATYTLTLKDSSIYTSENSKVFTVTIKKKEIAANELSLQIGFSAATYTGEAITSNNVQLQYGLNYLDAENYEVTYADNINVGEATVTATSKDSSNYSFVKSETFTINPKTLDENNIILDHIIYEYTGEEIEPGVTVKDGTTEVDRDDYTLVYLNNRAIGSGQIHVVSVDGANYTFNEVMAFDIVEAGGITILPVDNYYGATLLNSEDDLATIIPLTLDETSARAEGEEIVVYIEVTNLGANVPQGDKDAILGSLENNNLVYQFIDISLYKKVGDSEPVKVAAPTGKIKIQIDIPESLLNNSDIENIYVLRYHEGVVTRIPLVIVNGKGVLETDGFSTYALGYQVKAPETPAETQTTEQPTQTTETTTTTETSANPKTGDNIINITLIMIASIGSMILVNVRKLKEM